MGALDPPTAPKPASALELEAQELSEGPLEHRVEETVVSDTPPFGGLREDSNDWGFGVWSYIALIIVSLSIAWIAFASLLVSWDPARGLTLAATGFMVFLPLVVVGYLSIDKAYVSIDEIVRQYILGAIAQLLLYALMAIISWVGWLMGLVVVGLISSHGSHMSILIRGYLLLLVGLVAFSVVTGLLESGVMTLTMSQLRGANRISNFRYGMVQGLGGCIFVCIVAAILATSSQGAGFLNPSGFIFGMGLFTAAIVAYTSLRTVVGGFMATRLSLQQFPGNLGGDIAAKRSNKMTVALQGAIPFMVAFAVITLPTSSTFYWAGVGNHVSWWIVDICFYLFAVIVFLCSAVSYLYLNGKELAEDHQHLSSLWSSVSTEAL